MLQSVNTSNQKFKTFETFIGPKVKVTLDPKSKTKVINFPFDFPDDEKGVIIICKLSDSDWKPEKEISSISINFK